MSTVDALSDSELRTKLMEYGYPVGPVTQTTRKILVKKLKNLIETRGGTGSRHSLAARYSSEDTDDDSNSVTVKKKKATIASRRQTLANPMPPPSPVTVSSDMNVRNSPAKDKTSHSDFKDPVLIDYDRSSPTYTSHTISKTHTKCTKSQKTTIITDGLETGSDSDITEDAAKSYVPSKYLPSVGKSHDNRTQERSTVDYEQIPKSYESRPRSVHTIKDNKYNGPPFDPNISPIQPTKDDLMRDTSSHRDVLANYETPFLSEFTRRLSSRASMNLPSASLSNLKSSSSRHTSTLSDLNEKDSNGHFSSLRSLYSTSSPSSRHPPGSMDRSREIISRTFKLGTATSREDMRNNQNMVSVILVVVLALFFGILAVIYLGLGGKSDSFPSLSTGRYTEL